MIAAPFLTFLLVRFHGHRRHDRLAVTDSFRIANDIVLLGHGKMCLAERFTNQAIGIEVHLPVVIRMAVRSDREHRAGKIESEDFNIRRGSCNHVRNLREPFL